MMDGVTKNKASQSCDSRHGHDGVAAMQQGPRLHQMLVGSSGQGRPRSRDILIEKCEEIGP